MTRHRDLDVLAELEREKMDTMMTLARAQAEADYGADMGEDMFQDEWRAIEASMTNEINRNFANVNRLKYKYDARCESLLKEVATP